jgi:hypothetical protein
MEGALLKLSCDDPETSVRPGERIEIPVSVSRSVKLAREATVELEIPEELIGVIDAAPLILPADTGAGRFAIQTRDDPRLQGDWAFRLRATAVQDGGWPVTSYATVRLRFP